ncbi:MAG: hypothetical protein RJA10_4386 [Pseudomonadota bacterium]
MRLRTITRTVAALAACVPLLAQAGNVLMTDVSSVTVSGVPGVLRAGSPWAPAPAAENVSTLFDGNFLPTSTTWTHGTFWWDEDIRQGNPVTIEVLLNGPHTLNRFVVQGDNNEDYLVDWWDGSAWQTAYNAASTCCFGMVTRDSGLQSGITTDRLRIRAQGGDLYYSLSEVQAYDVNRTPEPGSLALAGLAAAGLWGASRRRRAAAR